MNIAELKTLQDKTAKASALADEIRILKAKLVDLKRGNRILLDNEGVHGGLPEREWSTHIDNVGISTAARQAVYDMIDNKVIGLETKFRDMK